MFFVFDISTAPDPELLFSKYRRSGKTTLSKKESAEPTEISVSSATNMPVSHNKIVSWVGLWIENNGSPRQQLSWSGMDEKEGLRKLFDALKMFKDFGLIHYNGRTTHLPLITYRALKHELVKPARLNSHDIVYRYSNQNIDLVDTFSNYGASPPPEFNDLAHLIDIRSSGSSSRSILSIQSLTEKKLEEQEQQLQRNVMKIYIIWLRLVYSNGNLKEEFYYNLKERALIKLNQLFENK